MCMCVSVYVYVCVCTYICESARYIPCPGQVLSTQGSLVSLGSTGAGPPLCHVPFFRRRASAPCSETWNHIGMSQTYKFSAQRLPSPIQVAWTHIETSTLCIPSIIAHFPNYQAHISSPSYSLPSSSSHIPTLQLLSVYRPSVYYMGPGPHQADPRSNLILTLSLNTFRVPISSIHPQPLGITFMTPSWVIFICYVSSPHLAAYCPFKRERTSLTSCCCLLSSVFL